MAKLLRSLAFNATAECEWRVFGFSPLEGPDPSEAAISARYRMVKLLLSAASDQCWSEGDRTAAAAALERFTAAQAKCSAHMAE
eukprot:10669926-Karenia_brevis.AAC.1